MGIMSFLRDDRVIFASLGVSVVGLVAVMHLWLTEHRDKSEIKPTQPKTQYITQETEDSLKLGTLETLLGHYNFAIRETAAKIICDRAVNDPETISQLLWGITRPDYDERMKNLRALAMITDQHSLHLLNTPKGYSAFVRSLELCVSETEYARLDDKHFDEYYLRDMAEKMCLMFIVQLINKFDDRALIRAKFVEKWLVKQNWGSTDEERQRNFSEYMQHKQNRITDICLRLQDSVHGRQALEKAKLLAEGSSRAEPQNDESNRFNIVLSISMNDNGDDQDEPRPRITDQSVEEQRLRRRHREAIVLNDGTRPLGRGDIIQHNTE